MCRQLIIKPMRNAIQLGQTRPRYSGEVMVLIVQSDVISQDIQGSVVGVCLGDGDAVGRVPGFGWRRGENVVLCNEVASARVKRTRQEGAQYQIAQCFTSGVLDEGVVEGELSDDVEKVDLRKG